MDTSDILSFGLCTNSENGQTYGTWQLEKNHMHTETERIINFIFPKNHYVINLVHGSEISTPGFFKISNYSDSAAHYLTEQRDRQHSTHIQLST